MGPELADRLDPRSEPQGLLSPVLGVVAKQVDASRRAASTAVGRGYASVVLRLKDRSGQATYAVESVDLRSLLTAGRSLHEHVTDALSVLK